MAVAVFTRYRSLSPSRYDEVVASLDLDADPPPGAMFHLAGIAADGLEVCEVWRTRETYDSFVDQRLRPALSQHRVSEEPEVRITALHNMFVPDMDAVERMGAVSLPAVLAHS